MNLVLGLVGLSAAATLVWAGVTNPEGGLLAGLRDVLAGNAPERAGQSAASAAFISSVAAGATATGGASATAAGLDTPSPVPNAAGVRGAVVAEAQTWLGVPYRWAGNTRAGVDCSGLTKAVYKKAARIDLPRVSAAQALTGAKVSAGAAQPGDLVAFGTPVHHVAIYIGGGRIIHAPHTGTVVRVESVWHSERVQYRNLLGAASSGAVLT